MLFMKDGNEHDSRQFSYYCNQWWMHPPYLPVSILHLRLTCVCSVHMPFHEPSCISFCGGSDVRVKRQSERPLLLRENWLEPKYVYSHFPHQFWGVSTRYVPSNLKKSHCPWVEHELSVTDFRTCFSCQGFQNPCVASWTLKVLAVYLINGQE